MAYAELQEESELKPERYKKRREKKPAPDQTGEERQEGFFIMAEPVNRRLKFNLATHQSRCWVSKLRASRDCFSRGHSSPRNLPLPAPVYLLSGILGDDSSP